MDDARAMRFVQRVGSLNGDFQRFAECQRAALESGCERLALEILHHPSSEGAPRPLRPRRFEA